MDERIEKVLKTDAEARKRIAQAHQRAKEVTLEVDTEIEKLRLQYEKKVETKLSEIKKEQQKSLMLLEKKKREETALIFESLERQSKEKIDEWVDEIYTRVISK